MKGKERILLVVTLIRYPFDPVNNTHVKNIGRMIEDGNRENDLWIEIFAAVDQRRRLVESERKRLEQMEQLVTVSEMMVLASALLSSIQTHVTDRRALAAISNDFARLTTIER